MSIRSTRRRRAFLAALGSAALIVGAAFMVPSWAATGGNPDPSRATFELEGNANNSSSYAGEDWSDVYGGASKASATSFVAESAKSERSASIFTGGGSKDPSFIADWRWKDGGGLPDKDNLQDAFAARYGPLIVFGSDRFDNSGDAMQGFWFFQNSISMNADGTFSGEHTEGDLLILSDFSIGGTVSQIDVYEWVDSGGNVSTHLQQLFDSSSSNCVDANGNPTDGDICGVVNASSTSGNETGGWPFTDKSGKDSYLQGEFFEGGIDLSAFPVFAGECFASFASETRSSQSPTATLKDLVVGEFEACGSSVSTAQTWIPNDSATVSVPGATNWNGSVTFSLRSGSCSGSEVYAEGPLAVSASAPTARTSNDGGSSGYVATASGDYFWQVDFTPATNGVKGSSHCESTSMTITN